MSENKGERILGAFFLALAVAIIAAYIHMPILSAVMLWSLLILSISHITYRKDFND